MTNSSIRSIIICINQISICRCSLMVKFELPKLASRVRFPSPAPYKKADGSSVCFLYIMKWELNPRRKPYNRRGDESGCILSQANTQKTAVKVHSPQRGAEGGLDSGIFPSPAFCYYNTLPTEPFSREGVTVCISYVPSELFASIISTQISVYSLYHISIRIKNIFDIKFIVWK